MKPTGFKLGVLLCCLSLLFLFAFQANAQDMQAIKSRMVERKPTIDALKNKGVIGEGNDGYLHFRQQSADAGQVVNAENADRRAVNTMIAKKEGTTVEQVSRTVGEKLRATASPGQWVQKEDGSWQKK